MNNHLTEKHFNRKHGANAYYGQGKIIDMNKDGIFFFK